MCIAMLFTFSFQYSCTKEICQLCGSELQRNMNVNMCQHLWCKLTSVFETPPSHVPRLPQTSTTTQLRHRTTTAFLYHPSHLKLHFFPQTPPLSLTHTVGDLICLDAVTPHSVVEHKDFHELCLSSLQGTSHLHNSCKSVATKVRERNGIASVCASDIITKRSYYWELLTNGDSLTAI